MIRIKLLVATVISACGIFMAIDCYGAGSKDSSIIEVRDFVIGFSGNYKLGYWAPAFVSLDAPTGTHLSLRLTVPDGDGVPTTTSVNYTVPPHTSDSPPMVELLCKIGRPDGTVELTVYREDQLVAREQYSVEAGDYKPLSSTTELIISLGTASNLQQACKQQFNSEGPQVVVVEMNDVAMLPTHALGYDGVDQIFCSGSQTSIQNFLDSEANATAVENWVRWGGHIVLSVGGNNTELFTGTNSFEKFLPGQFEKTISVRQLRPIEILGGGSDPLIKEDSRGRNQSFVIPVFSIRHGRIESSIPRGDQSIPLLVRAAMGFGQVTFLAVDVEQPEFETWNGTRNVIRSILFLDQKNSAKRSLISGGELAHSGYDDLAGQLRAALDQFEGQGVRFIPFELLFLFGIIYLLVIAVGDYFLLRKLRGRMELTWISFPLTVILFSVGIYGIARATKGDRQLVNQAEVIDIDLLTGQVRGSCWLSLFSPQTERYDLSASYSLKDKPQPDSEDAKESKNKQMTDTMLFSWMGLPGRGLGGMESPLATPVFELGYRYGPQLASLNEVPLSIWSTKCFSIRSQSTGLRAVEATLSERSPGEDALVEGSITNRMIQPLRDCVLLHNGWAYPLGNLAPNKPHAIDRSQSVRTIRNHLARLGPLEMESETQRFDVQRIFERMLFYQAGGGGTSILLRNEYLNTLDMSHLIENGGAVLVGLADRRAFDIYNGTHCLSDAQSLRAAVYRIVLPIQKFDSPQETIQAPARVAPPANPVLFAHEDPA